MGRWAPCVCCRQRRCAHELRGKLAAKAGKTKVKGVGKGLGEKIDEFLETGTMSRIAELEGQTDAAA